MGRYGGLSTPLILFGGSVTTGVLEDLAPLDFTDLATLRQLSQQLLFTFCFLFRPEIYYLLCSNIFVLSLCIVLASVCSIRDIFAEVDPEVLLHLVPRSHHMVLHGNKN